MPNRWTRFVSGLSVVCFVVLLASLPAPAASRPKARDANDPNDRKFIPPTEEVLARAKEKTEKYAKSIAAIQPKTHLIETDHFLLYSPWDRGADRELSGVVERMYKEMCKQFDIPATDNVWVNKCPVFIFDTNAGFGRFCKEALDKEKDIDKVAGFCSYWSDGFVYIVMNASRSKKSFYETLVHEATHGFESRYRRWASVPIWLNEGLAETVAAVLVSGSHAEQRYISATRKAIREKVDVRPILESVGLEEFDYGIAQSFVRFLIARDRRAFPKLFDLIKSGKTQAEALKEAYGFDDEQKMVQAWYRAAARGVR